MSRVSEASSASIPADPRAAFTSSAVGLSFPPRTSIRYAATCFILMCVCYVLCVMCILVGCEYQQFKHTMGMQRVSLLCTPTEREKEKESWCRFQFQHGMEQNSS
mmetsp:Transcript_9808/g.12744  ORF Transcript_9808/g.12744 Transcript_9808/m.12744 type:complete len:105 (-) Transcript_9808:25-339(-)